VLTVDEQVGCGDDPRVRSGYDGRVVTWPEYVRSGLPKPADDAVNERELANLTDRLTTRDGAPPA
jgi:hypothetical protein